MALPHIDFESHVRFPRPVAKHLRLIVAVVLFVVLGALLVSPGAREYVPYKAFTSSHGVDKSWGSSQRQLNMPVNVTITPAVDPITHRANATLVMLARNSDLAGVEDSMRAVELAFNHKHNYPWTFLNEVPFDLNFKRRVRTLTNGDVHFGLIKSDDWYPPEWVDEERYETARRKMQELGFIPYAGSIPYRNMCRFNSGFFFRQEVLKQFKWYWRIEPSVQFPCSINFDPFEYMIQNNKRYSFTIAIPEYGETITSLWGTVKDFMNKYAEYIPVNNAYGFLTDDDGQTYNRCHFWSNFEVADLDFFRSDAYMSFFSLLDSTGNFFYERWGDAPVHSIGAALLLPRDQIHYFRDIGYYHVPFWNCPDNPLNEQLQCTCKREQAFDVYGDTCLDRFRNLFPEGQIG